jgi:hypothetical protein
MIRTLLAALMFALAAPATAQPYLFAGTALTAASTGDSYAERDSRVFLLPGVGYRINRHMAVEAAWFDPGKVLGSFQQDQSVPGQSTITSRAWSVDGGRISLVGSADLGSGFSLLGAVNVYLLNGELREEVVVVTASPASSMVLASGTRSGHDTLLGVGVGLSYALPHQMRAQALLDWVSTNAVVFGDGLDAGRLRTFSISLVKEF